MPATIAAATGRTRNSAVSDSAAKRSEIPATIDATRTTRLKVSAKTNQRRRVRRRRRNRRSSLTGAATGGGRRSCDGGSKYVMLRETTDLRRQPDVPGGVAARAATKRCQARFSAPPLLRNKGASRKQTGKDAGRGSDATGSRLCRCYRPSRRTRDIDKNSVSPKAAAVASAFLFSGAKSRRRLRR
jgi:hypothetical protein